MEVGTVLHILFLVLLILLGDMGRSTLYSYPFSYDLVLLIF